MGDKPPLVTVVYDLPYGHELEMEIMDYDSIPTGRLPYFPREEQAVEHGHNSIFHHLLSPTNTVH